MLSELVCVSILNRSFNLRLVCCFLRFKKLKELSTAIFDSSINISVVLWFQPTWAILEIKGCNLAKYQRSRQRAKIFGLIYFPPSSLLISKIQGDCAKLVYFLQSLLLISKKKRHYLETAARERGVWLGMLDSLGGRQNFCLGGHRLALPPLVAALTQY